MSYRPLNRKIALLVGLLLGFFLVVGVLGIHSGSGFYRSVYYHSTFQKSILPPLQTLCSGIEKALHSSEEQSLHKTIERYQDLPVPASWKNASSIHSASGACRVFLLCLDGASWREIDELDPLPNFDKLGKEGIKTSHQSTILPISSCAWNAIDTGYLPGQTGVLAFLKPSGGWPPSWKMLSTRDFPTTTIAQRVERRGENVFTINLMNSYPGQIEKGIVVGGLWTNSRKDFASPPELDRKLRQLGYSPHLSKKSRLRMLYLPWAALVLILVILLKIKALKTRPRLSIVFLVGIFLFLILWSVVYSKRNSDFRTPDYSVQIYLEDEFYPRTQMALRLFKNPEWRFGALMLKGIDALGHSHDQVRSTRQRCYQEADRFLGELMERADSRTLLAVVSDHGMTYYPKVFDLPAWLYSEGYLSEDPATSKAVAVHEFAGNVGCVRLRNKSLSSEIEKRLKALKDPLSGQPVISGVYLPEQVFQGSLSNAMPELVIETHPDYQVFAYDQSYWRKNKGLFINPPSGDPLYAALTPYGPPIKVFQGWYVGGNHERQGLFALWGKPIKAEGQVNDIPIEDIAPTLMNALKLSLPEDLPGQAHPEWFLKGYSGSQPVDKIKDPVTPAPPPDSSQESNEALDTLKKIGYL